MCAIQLPTVTLLLFLLLTIILSVSSFSTSPLVQQNQLVGERYCSDVPRRGNNCHQRKRNIWLLANQNPVEENLQRKEAEELLQRAKELRSTLPDNENNSDINKEANSATSTVTSPISKWNVVDNSDDDGICYRLYLDIGREDGTWMDPRWGASGKRIDLTIDVKLLTNKLANSTMQDKMVKDNFGGVSSPVYEIQTANVARLRSGYDEMSLFGGSYRIDSQSNKNMGSNTIRFYIDVDGVGLSNDAQEKYKYGDVSIPKGCLYFSLPFFGSSIQSSSSGGNNNNNNNLSTKEGLVTVRQIGWHTGWRREESRMVGTFRAVPITKAKQIDGF